MRSCRSTVVFCAAIAILSVAQLTPMLAVGQEASPSTQPGDAQPLVEMRVYDVSDLLRPVNDYPAAALQSGHGFESIGREVAETGGPAEELASAIRDNVASATWKENGGIIGSVTQMKLPNMSLLISQTPENHEQITRMLNTIRERGGGGRMVCTRMYWLLLEPADVQAAFDAARPVKGEDGDANAAMAMATRSMPVVDDALMAKAKLYSQAQTTCFNGQTVAIQSGREWSIVSDLTPVVGMQAVGYDPTMERVSSGTTAQITPQLSGDGVLLDLHSTVVENKPRTKTIEAPFDGKIAATMPAIEMHDITRQSFATTVRIPLGKRVLLAGMTLEPQAGEAPGRQLYLAVEVTAVR